MKQATMDSFYAHMTNHFYYEGIEDRSDAGIRLRIRTGATTRSVWLPRRHVTLLPPDEVLIPQWLCEKARLTEHGKTSVQP